jgi:hypothetical protein
MSKQPPAPFSISTYNSRGSIFMNEFGSEIISEDIPGGVSLCAIHFSYRSHV